MSRGQEIAGSTATGDILRDWQATRGDATIQYAPLPPWKPPPPPEAPGWLKALSEWLADVFGPIGKALGMSWPVFQYVLIALAVVAVLFVLWRLVVEPLLDRRRQAPPPVVPEWAPDRAQAIALLDDADRLAAEGRFGEAAHLLLQRSVHHIAAARPDWLHPASTAREIMRMTALPKAARVAFATIAELVERSRYALRALDLGDWTQARAAYTDFALEKLDQKIEAAA